MKTFKQTAIVLGFIAAFSYLCTFCTGCGPALLVGTGGVIGYVAHDKIEKGELKLPCSTRLEETKK